VLETKEGEREDT